MIWSRYCWEVGRSRSYAGRKGRKPPDPFVLQRRSRVKRSPPGCDERGEDTRETKDLTPSSLSSCSEQKSTERKAKSDLQSIFINSQILSLQLYKQYFLWIKNNIVLITVLCYLFLLWHVRYTPTSENANNSSQFRFPLVLPQDYSSLLRWRHSPLRWWHINYALIFVPPVFQPVPYCARAELAQHSTSATYFRVSSLKLPQFSSPVTHQYISFRNSVALCYAPSLSNLVKPPHWKFSLLVTLARYSWGALNTDSHCANRNQCLCPVTVYLLSPSIILVCCPWIPATHSVERQPRHTALGTVQRESNDDEVEPAASFTTGLE